MLWLIRSFDVPIAGRAVTRTVVALSAALLATGCLARSPVPAAAAIRRESSRYALGQPELSTSAAVNAEEAIRALRPEWLRANPTLRHAEQAERAVVYVGYMYLGDLDALRLIQRAEVSSIQYLTPMEARGRFGPTCRCSAGAILINRVESSQP